MNKLTHVKLTALVPSSTLVPEILRVDSVIYSDTCSRLHSIAINRI